jgi:hypothetical protein
MFWKKKPKEKTGPVGGAAFFVSMLCLIFLGCFNLIHLPALWDAEAFKNLAIFFAAMIVGIWGAGTFVRGRPSVFLHELKHYIPSNFASNKSKGWKIKDSSGEYRYAYTKDTEKYNALIALSPYWFPLFTLVSLLLALVTYYQVHQVMIFIVGIGYGMDCKLCLRDISPVQTDITNITGGYRVGLLFISAMHLTIATMLAAWIFQDVRGLQFLFVELWDFMVHIVSFYREI